MVRTLVLAASLVSLAACSPAEEAEAPAGDTAASDAQAAPSPAPEDDIRHFLMQEYPDGLPMRYALAWSDLDGDGADEAIVHLVGSYFCGTGGCPTLVLTPAGPMWRKVADISVSRTPVTVMDTSTNGWKDITVAISGGGGEAGDALLRFDGEAYPSNPTVQPAEVTGVTGTVLIAEEPDFTDLAAEDGSGG
ncbi:hypothetical protein K3148_00800 [Qipengyuania aurantiaca]|uniref:VCBS repeat-containing protein n=1 Tax=Qipengyuania aurantiaca TaxID=2867233 RepID=A0ABX8ZS21_9SPHN|nr:hypothetical protein [Qipengyuania aurantiaca]QZD89988.1 hypothetical protein K3148_00800 [Qipengyuania aurantiaca]